MGSDKENTHGGESDSEVLTTGHLGDKGKGEEKGTGGSHGGA